MIKYFDKTFNNDGYKSEIDWLDEGLQIKDTKPGALYIGSIYSPTKGMCTQVIIPLYHKRETSPFNKSNCSFTTHNLLKALYIMNKYIKIDNKNEAKFYEDKAYLLERLDTENRVYLEGWQYNKGIVENNSSILPLYKSSINTYSFHGLVKEEQLKENLINKYDEIEWVESKNLFVPEEEQVKWAAELLEKYEKHLEKVNKSFEDNF